MKKLLLLTLFTLSLAAAGPAGPVLAAEGGHQVGAAEAGHGGPPLGEILPLWSMLPFAGILLSIALFPLLAPHFWHRHYPKVAAFWALAFALPFVAIFGGQAVHSILHIYLIDYIPFIILLGSLYTIAGGIYVKGTLQGKPVLNLGMLLIGTALASWIGTTGAAMVMIRPVLRANARRRYRAHTVIFFIFLVANIGGSLTPLGDPPLFLGFLHGVPFFWTMRLLPLTLLTAGLVAAVYFLLDLYYYRREPPEAFAMTEMEPLQVRGAHNFLILAGVVGGVLASGILHFGSFAVMGIHLQFQNLLRDLLLIVLGVISMATTARETRQANGFSWGPIKEVAYLFAGIFMTIIPALAILIACDKGCMAGPLGLVERPWHYFWATGLLSSFLDNAPTYLTFFNSALGKVGISEQEMAQALRGAAGVMAPEILERFQRFLLAIAAGAVFMGANTYIGNAPNFMVKSIAEESGVPMPSFFGYLFKYSVPVLIPVFIILTLIFFV